MVYGGKAETQALSPYVLVGVLAPLLGLERLPQGDGLAGGVPAMHPDEPPKVGQDRGRHLARTHVRKPPRPARETNEVAEVGPHDLGPKHPVLGRALSQRPFNQPLEVGRTPERITPGRMFGVPATILAHSVPELWIVEERPHFRVVGALEVVARLSGPARLEQDLEVLLGVARYPCVVERRAKQRTPAARRRTDQVRQPRPSDPGSSTHCLPSMYLPMSTKATLSIAMVKNTRNLHRINTLEGLPYDPLDRLRFEVGRSCSAVDFRLSGNDGDSGSKGVAFAWFVHAREVILHLLYDTIMPLARIQTPSEAPELDAV